MTHKLPTSAPRTAARTAFAAVALAALASSVAVAQAGQSSNSLAPAGQGPGVMTSQPSGSDLTSRATVKERTKAAEAAGTLQPAGQAVNPETLARTAGHSR